MSIQPVNRVHSSTFRSAGTKPTPPPHHVKLNIIKALLPKAESKAEVRLFILGLKGDKGGTIQPNPAIAMAMKHMPNEQLLKHEINELWKTDITDIQLSEWAEQS